MVHFDDNRVVVVFQRQQHRCPVCFGSFAGTEFTRLTNCRHFVCKECIKSLCRSLIKEGSLHKLQCMECQEELNPFDVQLSVEPLLWDKYQQFQLDNALSSMQARKTSFNPLLRAQKVFSSYVFCVHCRRGYHGVDPCAFNGDKRILVDEYEGADVKTKQNMEKRYGRARLRNLCDEIKAEEWVSKNAKQCPKCKFPVEKMGGCNKMVCSKCGSAFCWICMHRLTGVDPYDHFQDPQNKNCFMNLMMGIEDSDEEGGENDGDDFDEAAVRDDGLFVLEELRNVLGQAVRMLQNI
ncbi:hypothetical protein RvY_19441 [Ramazzottius varieornatus]|uniref:RBR-type E3 ubiquitin transferase n=1 Tax=Ramazzottius varieornatus TaxID=947166 RepID=A0A1D1W9D1_RAMVA|nr:hypothetical protein RvY_19441 [Ramazzottius varieornatus]